MSYLKTNLLAVGLMVLMYLLPALVLSFTHLNLDYFNVINWTEGYRATFGFFSVLSFMFANFNTWLDINIAKQRNERSK